MPLSLKSSCATRRQYKSSAVYNFSIVCQNDHSIVFILCRFSWGYILGWKLSCWPGETVDCFSSLTPVFDLPSFASPSRSVQKKKKPTNENLLSLFNVFGKYFLHRPIYHKAVVNVLPNMVLLKCSNCDADHSVGKHCPSVMRRTF